MSSSWRENMAKIKLPPLSAAEQALMDALWKQHPASVLELLDAVNAGRKEPVTRNTLQTQLTRLEAKGWIKRDDSGRSHAYEPVVAAAHGRAAFWGKSKNDSSAAAGSNWCVAWSKAARSARRNSLI
jgi:predicted transcriptional regulator